jgi:type IV secretory pathway ATPase VirB11/archaellum biosynthesis ATPase/intein/homing endonuclease
MADEKKVEESGPIKPVIKEKEVGTCDYTYDENKMKVRINCLGCIYGASIEDYEECMAKVIDSILEVKKVSSVVLAKEREYEYDYDQIKYLAEISKIIEEVIREKLISNKNLNFEECREYFPKWNSRLQYMVFELLRKDPVGAYAEVLREIRKVNIEMKKATSKRCYNCFYGYKKNALEFLKERLEKTRIIELAKPHIAGYHVGDRSIYRQVFMPSIRPNFMLTRYIITPPEAGKSVDRYEIGDTEIEVFKLPGSTQYFYYALPPEFKLSEEHYAVLDAARHYMATHRPKTTEFVRSERVREIFYNIGKDMIREMAEKSGVSLSSKELERLATILTRYTSGLGVLEILLSDEKVTDLYINSPIERQPILINHSDWEECKTNLIPTMEDAEAWATRLRIMSGRPLDEANPVLDVDIGVPGGKARFAVITRNLSPQGLGFAIRRHRDKPWTLPLFIKTKTVTPLAAGLLSFLIDGSVSLLVAGGRGAGKTSILGSLMLEILPKTRIVTIEDSVTGDCGLVYERNGRIERGTVGDLVDEMVLKYGEEISGREIACKNPENIGVYSMGPGNKVKLSRVSRFIRHKVNKPIYEVETRTGKKIKITGDHSLFTLGSEGKIEPIKAKGLKRGDFIVSPRILHNNRKPAGHLNMMEFISSSDKAYVSGEGISKMFDDVRLLSELAGKNGYSEITVKWWKRNGILPYSVLLGMIEHGHKIDPDKTLIKFSKNSRPLPLSLKLNGDFLKFIGLWLADGCYDRNSVIVSAQEEEIRDVVRKVAKGFGLEARMHSDKFSLMMHSNTLKYIMKNVLELAGDAFTKRIPSWIFNLSKKQIGCVINGLLSGDGCVSDKEIMIDLRSRDMIRDLQTLLLMFGITGRVSHRNGYALCRISSLGSIKKFRNEIGILPGKKLQRLDMLCEKTSTHDSTDVIPFPMETKSYLSGVLPGFNSYDYITRDNNIGRGHFNDLMECIDMNVPMDLSNLADSDIFWDEIRDIKTVEVSDYVYDFSVLGNENFVCENILAHNTLELPVDQLRDLHYNIEQLKSRSVITRIETEMPADEALRTSLRLGDSALVVGEVRSVEAKALYEAMRVGALSNVVAGTIHGESAYGVYDRVVNDLGVPPTSFKATDVVPICKSLRSADGLHRYRRMTEITEIRKNWDEDPVKEGGFINLMEYSGKQDMLKPTDTLVNGESEVLNRIASYVKEWSGNWEAVWENINMRANIKKTMVDIADEIKNADILEADWCVRSNIQLHLIQEAVRKEIGEASPTRVYEEWLKWFKNEVKTLKPRNIS